MHFCTTVRKISGIQTKLRTYHGFPYAVTYFCPTPGEMSSSLGHRVTTRLGIHCAAWAASAAASTTRVKAIMTDCGLAALGFTRLGQPVSDPRYTQREPSVDQSPMSFEVHVAVRLCAMWSYEGSGDHSRLKCTAASSSAGCDLAATPAEASPHASDFLDSSVRN